MKGYARRKVTYNLGRGGRGNTAGKQAKQRGHNKIRGRTPFGMLNEFSPKQKELYCILDNGMTFFIDEKFRNIGEEEGWLKLSGYYRQADGRLVWTFEHIG